MPEKKPMNVAKTDTIPPHPGEHVERSWSLQMEVCCPLSSVCRTMFGRGIVEEASFVMTGTWLNEGG